jgi:hypothetical protein
MGGGDRELSAAGGPKVQFRPGNDHATLQIDGAEQRR